MATFIEETLFADSISYKDKLIQFGLDSDLNLYISNGEDDASSIYLTFSFDDWLTISSFINEKFREVKKPF